MYWLAQTVSFSALCTHTHTHRKFLLEAKKKKILKIHRLSFLNHQSIDNQQWVVCEDTILKEFIRISNMIESMDFGKEYQ